MSLKERFIPVQIDQDACMHCERCVRACQAKAIYFDKSIRLVDYEKCRGCLNCVQVCPRNAVEVTSVMPGQVIGIKIDHDTCTMCEKCLVLDGKFCPQHLFYKGDISPKKDEHVDGIKYKFREIEKCQGCLKCVLTCPDKAIKAIKYKEE